MLSFLNEWKCHLHERLIFYQVIIMNSHHIPPGPKGTFLTGNLAAFSDNPLDFLSQCARDYGDVVRIAKYTYLVSHPNLIEDIFTNKNGIFEKIAPADEQKNHSAFPDAVMNSSGDDWKTRRRKLQPAFHKELIRQNISDTAAICTQFFRSKYRATDEHDMRQQMAELSMEVGSRFLFGVASSYEKMQEIATAVEVIMTLTRNQIRFPLFIPTKNNLRLRRARRDLDLIIDRIVAEYREGFSDHTCLLGLLLAEDDTGNSSWIRDELATMIMSGLEPMSDALTWTSYLLALHPDINDKLFQEVDAVIDQQGHLPADKMMTPRYTEAVIKEALRLYPPAWMTGRIVTQDCMLGGYHIPADVTLAVSQWVTHRDPRFYAKPDEFCPERWLETGFSAALPHYAYFPFGGGMRKCPGNHLTMVQISTVIALFVHQFTFKLAPDAVITPYPALVLRPLGIRMSVEPRIAS